MHYLILILALIFSAPALAQRNPFPPVDEAIQNPSFHSFRTQLMGVVAARDEKRLLQHLDEAILFSFGDSGSIDGFRREWRPERRDSRLWGELERVLRLGGSFVDGEFAAPYVFSRWPDELDAFEHIAVVASGLRIRSAPSIGAPVIGNATYEILARDLSAPETPGWTAVLTPQGRRGYVASSFVRSPLDYRALFHEVDGRWKMRAFLAGD
jgi:hypothetical protein